MKYLLILVLISAVACGQNDTEKTTNTTTDTTKANKDSAASADSSLGVYKDYLFPFLVNHLSSTMPEWTLPDPGNWEKRWWDQYKKEKSLASYISGDFNCDSKTDHAMILLNQKNIGAWAFLARDNGFESVKLDQFENLGNQVGAGLQILTPGKHGDLNKEDINYRVDVKCEGIVIIFFEKAARGYYFEDGKLKWIQTAD